MFCIHLSIALHVHLHATLDVMSSIQGHWHISFQDICMILHGPFKWSFTTTYWTSHNVLVNYFNCSVAVSGQEYLFSKLNTFWKSHSFFVYIFYYHLKQFELFVWNSAIHIPGKGPCLLVWRQRSTMDRLSINMDMDSVRASCLSDVQVDGGKKLDHQDNTNVNSGIHANAS